ncbi:MAG: hypothetical protein IJU95_09120, partial [Treponema sp.]|nr:hypothetical protein [Treponema sp.]
LAAVGLLVVLLVILTLPFSFTYLVLLTKQETGVLESFTVSWRLLSGQIFHFVGFVIYSCGRDLAMVIVIQLMLLIMPKGEGVSMYLQLLSTIASFMGVLAEYRVMTRGHMAICIYFFSEAGILHPHGGQETMTTGPEAMPDCIDAGSCSGNSDSGGSQGDVGE